VVEIVKFQWSCKLAEKILQYCTFGLRNQSRMPLDCDLAVYTHNGPSCVAVHQRSRIKSKKKLIRIVDTCDLERSRNSDERRFVQYTNVTKLCKRALKSKDDHQTVIATANSCEHSRVAECWYRITSGVY